MRAPGVAAQRAQIGPIRCPLGVHRGTILGWRTGSVGGKIIGAQTERGSKNAAARGEVGWQKSAENEDMLGPK